MSARRARPDEGAASVLVVALAAVAVLLAGAGAALGQVEVVRSRVQTAADLAALAGAARLERTADVAASCALADEVVRRNGAAALRCEHQGHGIVEVAVRAGSPVGDATATARAGPASARPG